MFRSLLFALVLVGLLPLLSDAASAPDASGAGEPAVAGVMHYIFVPGLGYQDSSTGSWYTFIRTGTTIAWHFEPNPQSRSLMMSATSFQSVSAAGVNRIHFDSGVRPPGPSPDYTFTFTTQGVYEYNCTVHSNARGLIVVQN